MKGFYRRPSKAIEQGGGFFIPGLEGERIRIVTALALLVALLGLSFLFSRHKSNHTIPEFCSISDSSIFAPTPSLYFFFFLSIVYSLQLVVNQIGQTFTTFNEVVSESIGVITLILLFIQGVSAGLLEKDVIEVTQTFMSILQSSNDEAARRAETISKSIIQSCEDINYILVLSRKAEQAKLILEYAPIGAVPATKEMEVEVLRSKFQFQADSVNSNSKAQVVDGALTACLPISRQANGNSGSVIMHKMNDYSGNTWLIGIDKNGNEEAAADMEWISKLIQAPDDAGMENA